MLCFQACGELCLPSSEFVLSSSPGDPTGRALPRGTSQCCQQYWATCCQLLWGQEGQRWVFVLCFFLFNVGWEEEGTLLALGTKYLLSSMWVCLVKDVSLLCSCFSVSCVSFKAVIMVVVVVLVSVWGQRRTRTQLIWGLLPHSSFVFPVFFFSFLLSYLFAYDPVDIAFLRFSSFLSFCFPPWVTHWKMSGSPEVSEIF